MKRCSFLYPLCTKVYIHILRSNKGMKHLSAKEKRIAIIGSIVLVIAVIAYFAISMQLQFILEEEMYLDLVPLEKSITLSNDESVKVNFTLAVDNPSVCDFSCKHVFKDVSTGEIISSKTTSEQLVSSDYVLSVESRGSGQKVYSYHVTCHNEKSNLCSTNEKNYFKTSLVTLNYELSQDQREVKNTVRPLLTTLRSKQASIAYDMHQAKLLGDQLHLIVDVSLDDLNELVNPLQDAWEEQRYSDVYNKITPTLQKVNFILNETNATVQQLQQIKQQVLQADKFLYEMNNASLQQDYEDMFYNTSFYDEYRTFLSRINISNSSKNYQKFIDQTRQSQIEYEFVKVRFNTLQRLQTKQVNVVADKLSAAYNSLNISRDVNSTCSSIRDEQKFIAKRNNQVRQSQSLLNLSINWTTFSQVYLDTKNVSSFSTSKHQFSTPALWDLVLLTPVAPCKNSPHTIVLANYTRVFLPPVSPPVYEVQPLKQHQPQCCYDGECQTCCPDDSCDTNYPVLFVHGHALSQDNRPEESHSAFGKIQRLLEQEGYINAGQLSVDSNSTFSFAEWGRTNAPISIRLSYYIMKYTDVGKYHILTRKADHIENYALRLKEMVDTVKYRTGQDKVNIVAHSMGGLVVRQYIALFGEDAVDKFIMVGTPNKGVDGRARKWCSLTGASAECEDMTKNSVFMNRLNTPENTFSNGYTIRAEGCGEFGDGIVSANSVPLNYTTNLKIKGNCTDALQSNLHTRMMDPDEYPQTYDLILDILQGRNVSQEFWLKN